jgi:hypothetical protein
MTRLLEKITKRNVIAIIGTLLLCLSMLAAVSKIATEAKAKDTDRDSDYNEALKRIASRFSAVPVVVYRDGKPGKILVEGRMTIMGTTHSYLPNFKTACKIVKDTTQSVAAQVDSADALARPDKFLKLVELECRERLLEWKPGAKLLTVDAKLVLPNETMRRMRSERLKQAWEDFEK